MVMISFSLSSDLHSRSEGQDVAPFPKAKLVLADLKIDAVPRTTKHVEHAIYGLCTMRSVGSGTRPGKRKRRDLIVPGGRFGVRRKSRMKM